MHGITVVSDPVSIYGYHDLLPFQAETPMLVQGVPETESQAIVSRQVPRNGRYAVARQVVRRCTENTPVTGQDGQRDQPRIRHVRIANGNIDRLLVKVCRAIGNMRAQRDVGVLKQEAVEPGQQMIPPKVR